MKKKQRIIIISITVLLLTTTSLMSVDKIDDLSFTNTEITEVLKTVSEIFGVTIVPDKDVRGPVTRYFKDTSLEQTLTLLLEPLGYMYEIKNDIYFVKKRPPFTVEYDEKAKTFNVNSKLARLHEITDTMSLISKTTIIFKGNDEDYVNIHIFNKNMTDTLTLLTESLNYKIKKEGQSYIVEKQLDPEDEKLPDVSRPNIFIKGEENNLRVKIINKSSNDLITKLFNKYQKKLSLLSKKSIQIPYLDVDKVTFDELLNIVCQHSDQAYSKINDVYYIYDALGSRSSNPYRVTGTYKLKNLNYKSFLINVPPQVVPQTAYKIDAENNVVTVFGSPNEVDLYLNYIRKIDQSQDQYEYRVFKLKHLEAKDIKRYLPEQYQRLKIATIETLNMFSVYLDDYSFEKLKEYIDQIDTPFTKEFKYKFKYLNPEEVAKSMLPKKIKKDSFIINKNDSSIIFNIPEEVKKDLFTYLDSIDVPKPIIRYQLLIVEYSEKNSFTYDWGVGLKSGLLPKFEASAGLGPGINANFDIPTIFGYYFNAYLKYQLTEEKARIQMSTEVYGLSGETVNLTSTQTHQYKDEIITENNETKPVYNSTTFGLTLDIKGRATTADEVFIEINARISDQIGKSEGGGSAPNTSEKSVKNAIRSHSGRPIILGGLVKNQESKLNGKIPGLGDIPFIGNAFKSHDNSYLNSEFVIYIIPFIQKSSEDLKKERNEYIGKIYNQFVKS